MTAQAQPIGSGNPAPGFRDHPEHKVTREPFEGLVEVRRNQVPLARTEAAVLVRETGHTPVLYLPLMSLNMDEMASSEHTTYCPFKGAASYYSFGAGGTDAANAAWSYEAPYDEAAALASYLAFYPNRVDEIAVE